MKEDKINILFYALPNVNSGGYSVVLNLYEDLKMHKDEYPDIHWHIIVGKEGLESTENITIYNEERFRKTYLHRLYFNIVKAKKFVKTHDIKAVISINVGLSGLKKPSIISFHNVLPLYNCDFSIFDRKADIVKQKIINKLIVRSLKNADYVIIPSLWIRNALIQTFGLEEKKICISPIGTPEIGGYIDKEDEVKQNTTITQFIYPSSGYPYKNHRVIVEAAKILKAEGINDFCVKFPGNVGDGKTIRELKNEIERSCLPIEFCGLVSKEELAKSYDCGVLIFPSKIETDGFPLLESMSCGGRILAADLPYAREAVQDYQYCHFFDPNDSKMLAQFMRNEICSDRVHTVRNKVIPDYKPRSEIIVPLVKEIAGR